MTRPLLLPEQIQTRFPEGTIARIKAIPAVVSEFVRDAALEKLASLPGDGLTSSAHGRIAVPAQDPEPAEPAQETDQ